MPAFPDPLPDAGEHCTEGPVRFESSAVGGKIQACSLLGQVLGSASLKVERLWFNQPKVGRFGTVPVSQRHA